MNFIEGKYALKNCGPGTLFHPMLNICDWPLNVYRVRPECEAEKPTTPVPPTQKTTSPEPSGVSTSSSRPTKASSASPVTTRTSPQSTKPSGGIYGSTLTTPSEVPETTQKPAENLYGCTDDRYSYEY